MLKKIWLAIKKYAHKNPAIAYGWLVVISTYIVKKFPDLPNELIAVSLLSLLGLGKRIQSIENEKTKEALYTMPPIKKE
jgi:hypothetical protein